MVTAAGYAARALARGEAVEIPPPPTPQELAAWMESEGLGAATVAQIAGVDRSTVYKWLRGELRPDSLLRDALMQRWGSAP